VQLTRELQVPNLGNLSHPKVFSTQTGETATWNRPLGIGFLYLHFQTT